MPSWWKSRSKSKSKAKHSPVSESTPRKRHDWRDEDCSLTPKNYREASKEKANSFDGVLGGRKSKDLSASPSTPNAGEGESRSGFAFGHPLPRPFVSSPLLFRPPLDVAAAIASGSASASSVSSSGSSDDAPDLGFYRFTDSINMERGRRVLPELRRHQHASEDGQLFFCSPGLEQRSSEMPVSPSKEVHLHCFNPPSSSVAVTNSAYIFNCQTVNCTPSSRESPFCTSPVHPAVPHISPRSPTGRQDGLKSPPQPLPLPPVTPCSPTSSRAQTQWKKGKLLGRGTFGHVYLGFNSESGQMCAIKEVPVISDDSNSRESLKQLNQEINLLSQFSHPNIVQYLSSELVEDTLSVYLEYVSGGSIHKLLQEYGTFGEPVIRNYTAQILSGLAYLHGRNTVHRDIKGANILVDPNGEVKLADFGMAKHISSYASIRSFKGSPYWMAPEVIMNGNGYNLSVDIWSLGCTVLEMATSKPPWSQFEGVAAIFKIGNSKDIPDIPDHLSSEAKTFIKSCLQRDPSARPTAVQLMDHPFVRDQVTLKSAKSSMKKDAFFFPFDGNYSMAKNDRRESRSVSPLRDHTYGIIAHGSRIPFSHEKQSTPIGMRMNMSLPVSPCSSPRRQHVESNRSCLPSPTHPANSAGGQTYGQSSHYLYQTRPNHHFQDPFLDVSELRIRTPYGSPRG